MCADRLTLELRVTHPGFELQVSDSVQLDGVTAVIGPSGSGKSTLLRSIAGFDSPSAGRVACGNETWFDSDAGIDIAPHRRPVGTLFQDTRLFRHLDVAGNLDFADARAPRDRRQPERGDIIAALDLNPLMARRVASLSGGERQRVALGQTLLTRPRLLLLDEPLAALDPQRKAEILPYLENLRHFGIPALYVSHDVDEVARLADRAIAISGGRIQLHGAIDEVVARLDLQLLDGRFDPCMLIEGQLTAHDHRLQVSYVDLAGDRLTMPLVAKLVPGDSVRLRVRARDVALATQKPEAISIRNIFAGKLTELANERDNGSVLAMVETRGARIRARLTLAAAEDLGLETGQDVFVLVKSVSFDRTI